MADRLLSTAEIRKALGGMAPSTLYRHIKDEPGFPKPVKVGYLTRFRESDLQTYLNGLDSPRDAGASGGSR